MKTLSPAFWSSRLIAMSCLLLAGSAFAADRAALERDASAALQKLTASVPRVPNPDVPPQRPDDAFATALELACGQGLVLDARQGSRFIITLEVADDGPEDLRDWQARHDGELRERSSGWR